MKWPLLLLALAGCDRVFGLDRAPPDAPPGPPDAPPDAAIDAPPPCTPPAGTPTGLILPGTFQDFSPSEDDALALVTQTGLALEYTEHTTAPFGTTVNGTNITGMWGRVVLSPEGDRAFLSNASAVIFTSMRSGPPGAWDNPKLSGLPNGLPGRPSAGNARIVVENGGRLQEYERSGDIWSAVGPQYTSATFGHGVGVSLTYANLTADGRFLVYVVPSLGTFFRARGNDGTFGTTGAYLTSGDVRFPVLINCRILYVVQSAQGFPVRYVFPP